jgi:alkaline phosphatase D
MQDLHSRRDFIRLSVLGFGTAVLSSGLTACFDSLSHNVKFLHAVASGDPLSDRVILWTRVTPVKDQGSTAIKIAWEVARDPEFRQLVNSGSTETSAARDYTIKIDAAGLAPGSRYYYRFRSADQVSPVGTTRTLPDRDATAVTLAVVSCSNYPAGRFHVYREISLRQDLDAVLHLGDYIYEYPRGGYASGQAAQLGREVLPEGEILTLQDYRARYAQYRSDADLQAAHQQHPFIAVWDDHEIANNTWREGAENHQSTEGDFQARRLQALQAYAEWMPVRPLTDANRDRIYRSFAFGRLVSLHMLDTRVIARDEQLQIQDYFDANGFDAQRFFTAVKDDERTLLGNDQREWLFDQLQQSESVWQVLGQQILMGRMELPGAVATQRISFAGFARLVQLATREAQGMTLSPEDQAFLDSQRPLLALPYLPYNLDAWDGYDAERNSILNRARTEAKNLVVLAGDTHNAWANYLTNGTKDVCAIEFATASVSSPGLEEYLNLPPEAIVPTETQLTTLIDGLEYTNISNRGFLTVRFTEKEARAEFTFIDSVFNDDYRILSERAASFSVEAGSQVLRRLS